MAPPGNQAATEKTNLNLYHSENPVYSPKVDPAGFDLKDLAFPYPKALFPMFNRMIAIGTIRSFNRTTVRE